METTNKSCRNIYKSARIRAGFKREPVAEELHIDVRTLDKYESVGGKAPDEIVRRMCILYDNNFLAYQHLKQSPLGEFLPELTEDNIQGATLNLLCNFKDVQGIIQELVEFAAGQADGTNRADMERNRDKLLALASASITLLFADKEGYREGTQND